MANALLRQRSCCNTCVRTQAWLFRLEVNLRQFPAHTRRCLTRRCILTVTCWPLLPPCTGLTRRLHLVRSPWPVTIRTAKLQRRQHCRLHCPHRPIHWLTQWPIRCSRSVRRVSWVRSILLPHCLATTLCLPTPQPPPTIRWHHTQRWALIIHTHTPCTVSGSVQESCPNNLFERNTWFLIFKCRM